MRLAKNKPAAVTIIRHPAIVKIVVPIPPVDGREESLVFFTSTFFSLPSIVIVLSFSVPSSLYSGVITTVYFVLLMLYPSLATVSTNSYVPASNPSKWIFAFPFLSFSVVHVYTFFVTVFVNVKVQLSRAFPFSSTFVNSSSNSNVYVYVFFSVASFVSFGLLL